jgi:ubiquinone/menaquinone biosynthesis C-methylase UbiE
MRFPVPERRFDPDTPEMMDLPGVDKGLLEEDLRNLRIINRFLGGLRAVRRHITPLIERIPPNQEIRILDLASGSGDHPLALVKFARGVGRRIHVTAVDRNPTMIGVLQKRTQGFPEIEIREADILNLGGGEWEADIVLCSLALHHFSTPDAVRLIATMHRLSRVGFIVNDLNRSWVAGWSAWIYAHLTTRNPLTLNDSYVSVLRAFTPSELRIISERAGVARFWIHHEPMFRLVLVGER